MNLNKYTKAELISKIKRSDVESNQKPNPILNQINNYFIQLWELILTFKNILLKLTLISFFIQIFKKYKIFRKLWTLLNTIIMSVFGLSLIDNFGFEFITNFLIEVKTISYSVINYLSNTHFYRYLSGLFSVQVKEDISSNEETSKNESISSIKRKEERIIEESGSNHKISEWLKPEQTPEIIQEESSNNKKYLIIAGILLLACLSWYYQEEIKTGTASLIDWINSLRRGGNTGDTTPKPTSILIGNVVDHTQTQQDIELIDKGKNKVLTSPSLEDLNEKVKEYWSEPPKSPESTTSSSSTETITPSNISSLNELTSSTVTERSNSPNSTGSSTSTETITQSYSILTPVNINNIPVNEINDFIIKTVKKEWKNLIPIKNKLNFVEENIIFINNYETFKDVVSNLDEIKKYVHSEKEFVATFKSQFNENDMLQINLILELTDNWIREYQEKIHIGNI